MTTPTTQLEPALPELKTVWSEECEKAVGGIINNKKGLFLDEAALMRIGNAIAADQKREAGYCITCLANGVYEHSASSAVVTEVTASDSRERPASDAPYWSDYADQFPQSGKMANHPEQHLDMVKDAAELRDIAQYFDERGKKSNGDFLRKIADLLFAAPVSAGLSEEMVEQALEAFNEFPCPMGSSIARSSNMEQMRTALTRALASRLRLPDGYVAMPTKLTREMECIIENNKCVYRSAQELYDDLIAAAPSEVQAEPREDQS